MEIKILKYVAKIFYFDCPTAALSLYKTLVASPPVGPLGALEEGRVESQNPFFKI